MATSTIKSSGGDYSSLSAWEAARQAVLSEPEIAECYSFEDTTSFVIDGWTTTSANYIEIRTPQGERHNGKWNTSKYRLVVNDDYNPVINIVEDYVRIIGLQIHCVNTLFASGILSTSAGQIHIISNVIRGGGSVSGHEGINFNSIGNCTAYVVNNVIYDFYTGFAIDYPSGTTEVMVAYNNTIHSCTEGCYWYDIATLVAKNNLHYGCTNVDYNFNYNGSQTTSNNISEDATSPDTSYRNKTVVFVDAANDDFHLGSSDTAAKGNGTNLSADGIYAFSLDIDGDTRPSTWDIGADQEGVTGQVEGAIAWLRA